MKHSITFFSCLICIQLFACCNKNNEITSGPNNVLGTDTMKLRITVGQTIATATLNDNPTTKDFVSLLPLNLALSDYSNTEKISTLSRRLIANGAPTRYEALAGTITYYIPGGNLALFYKDFSYSTDLVAIGKLDNNIELFSTTGSVQVKIELLR